MFYKNLLFTAIILMSYLKTEATPIEHEVVIGSLTYHFFDFKSSSHQFENKVSSDGMLISNPMIGYLNHNLKDYSNIKTHAFLVFEDSIGSPAGGYFKANSKRYFGLLDVGFFYGGYLVNNKEWEKKRVDLPINIEFAGDASIIPIFGLRFSQEMKIDQTLSLRLNATVSPSLITLTLGFMAVNFN